MRLLTLNTKSTQHDLIVQFIFSEEKILTMAFKKSRRCLHRGRLKESSLKQDHPPPAFICSNSIMETLEQCVKAVNSYK